MSLGKIRTLTTFPTGDPAFDRYQQHVKQQLTPVLQNPLLSAVDFRWNEIAGVSPAAPTFALQYRSGSTWTTIVSCDSTGSLVQTVPPAWIAPALLNGWANFGGGFLSAGYFKDSLGFVHLRGTISNAGGTAANNPIFTLPAGYRPSAQSIASAQDVTAAAGAYRRIDITTAGNLVTGVVAAGSLFSLDGIAFDTRS